MSSKTLIYIGVAVAVLTLVYYLLNNRKAIETGFKARYKEQFNKTQKQQVQTDADNDSK